MSTINAIKIKQADGTYSSEIPIGTSVGNVQWDSTNSLADILGTVDFSTNGSIQNQINVLSEGLLEYVADYVDPTSSTKTEGVIEGDLANNTAGGQYSHAEGSKTSANYKGSHAEGYNTVANGDYAHAEGYNTHASMTYAHAEGSGTMVFAPYAHAEGKDSSIYLTAQYSHAQGQGNFVRGKGSHAEGYDNITGADANYSHVEGGHCTTSAAYSHAGGYWTKAAGESQTVIGQFNVEDDHKYLFIIGNGSDNDTRSNAFAVTWEGDIVLGRSPISTVAGSSVSLANNTVTTVASITLDKGNYILTGVARFGASATGRRTMLFAKAQNSGNPYDIFALEQINPSQSGVTYNTLTWPVEITADNTTVYLNVSQNSGGALTVDNTGIKVVRIG